jgi:hypothetical protein
VATIESERPRTEPAVSRSVSSGSRDETKLSFKTTEFWAMGGVSNESPSPDVSTRSSQGFLGTFGVASSCPS